MNTFRNIGVQIFAAASLLTTLAAEEKPRVFEKVQFIVQTNGPLRGTPVYADGKIYVCSGDGNLYCLGRKSGKEIWRYGAESPMNSTPAVRNNVVYCTAKDGMLRAVDASSGKGLWSFSLGNEIPYKNGFDYYVSSPTLEGEFLYVGSGDGNVYSINIRTHAVNWKYSTGARVRTTPAVDGGTVYAGNVNGLMFALDKTTGALRWKFETEGVSLKIENFGYDRSAILSSPTISNGVVLFGGRDGFLYALDALHGTLKWKFDHQISWVISKPLVVGEKVFVGSSDGHFVQCVDINTGAETWRWKTVSGVWANPVTDGSSIYVGDFAGWVEAADINTGTERWKFRTGGPVYGSPLLYEDLLYCGSDDGALYAFHLTRAEHKPVSAIRKAVFWEPDSVGVWFRNGTDVALKDFFVRNDYELIDSIGLRRLMEQQVAGRERSLVLFAQNKAPRNICGDYSRTALMRTYLEAGGTMVWFGAAPVAYFWNGAGSGLDSLNYSYASSVLGIRYPGKLVEGLGLYAVRPTAQGTQRGLKGWWVGFGWVDEADVTEVLARDEQGNAALWHKQYGAQQGTGLIQLWVPRDKPTDLLPLRNAIDSFLH